MPYNTTLIADMQIVRKVDMVQTIKNTFCVKFSMLHYNIVHLYLYRPRKKVQKSSNSSVLLCSEEQKLVD